MRSSKEKVLSSCTLLAAMMLLHRVWAATGKRLRPRGQQRHRRALSEASIPATGSLAVGPAQMGSFYILQVK